MKTCLTLTVCVFVLLRVPASFAVTYTTLDHPGALSTQAFAINKFADVVGTYIDSSGVHGFLLSNGVYTTIDPPTSTYTVALGINDQGEIVGYYAGATGNHGFVLVAGTYTDFDYPGAEYTTPISVNNAGQVVGTYYLGDGINHGFEYSNGSWTNIDGAHARSTYPLGINNHGDVFGDYYITQGVRVKYQGYLQTGTFLRLLTPPERQFDTCGSVNDQRQVLGSVANSDGSISAIFFHAPSTYQTLPNISTAQPPVMYGCGLNNSGTFVGFYNDSQDAAHGYIGAN